MKATTSPWVYRRFNDARFIEFYADPAKTPDPVVLSPTSDWGALSKASSAGRREWMEGVTAHIEWPGEDGQGGGGLPGITLTFTYVGMGAHELFSNCYNFDEVTNTLPVYLWRFRVTGHDGEAIELCFRACLSRMNVGQIYGQPIRISGTLRVLDAQPFMEEV